MHAGPLRDDDDDDRPDGKPARTDAGIEWIGIGCTHCMQGPRPSGRPQLCFYYNTRYSISLSLKKKIGN
jgi:hypothetical protein